jgi:membrane-associated phospholipid phosphatase
MVVSGDSGRGAKRRSRGYLPADFVLLAFLAITGFVLVVSPLRFPGKATYGILHFTTLLVVILMRFVPLDGAAPVRFVRRTYPLLALPLLYASVRYLNRLVTSGYYDGPIVRLEQSIFSSQPSQWFHLAAPWLPLSEFLHMSYLIYMILIPIVAIPLLIEHRHDDLAVFTTSVMATFSFCYTVFTFFPVRGPYYYFGPINPAGQGVIFPQLVHRILEGASSAGSAFPSSHVAVAVCIALIARRFYPRWGWALLLLAAGIFFGTVYGGYHYAVDAIAGLIVGIAGGLGGPLLHAWILRRQRAADAPAAVEEERARAS